MVTSRQQPILVFAYDFPHRKTADFLIEIAMARLNAVVIGAPWRALNYHVVDVIHSPISAASPHAAAQICDRLGFRYCHLGHNDRDSISQIVSEEGCDLAIISGARILKEPVISLFGGGVVNFHPGRLPDRP